MPTTQELSKVKSLHDKLKKGLRGSSSVDHSQIIMELLIGFPAQSMSEDESALRMNAYLTAVEGLPAWAVARGAESWIKGYGITGKEDFSFAPKPPQLAILSRRAMDPVQRAVARCRTILDAEMADRDKIDPDERKRVGEKMKRFSKWLSMEPDTRPDFEEFVNSDAG